MTMPSLARFVRRHTALAVLTASTLSVGCNDESRTALTPPRPAPLPVASNAWIVLSDSTPAAGSEVVIAAYASAEGGGAIGSFTARFLYDTLQLQVLAADSVPDAALRAMNPIPGEHRIAGASASGIPSGLLFRLKARVVDPRGVRRLGLLLDELHSITLADLTQRLEVRDTRGALFDGMRGVRVRPDSGGQP